MKKIMIAIFLLLAKNTFSIAQNIDSDTTIYLNPDQSAEFQGGMGAFGKFLQKNLKYPEAAQRANVTGKIYMEFIVETDSTLSNYNILKSVGFGVDEEAIRVLNLSPKWIPAKYKGKNVRSRFTIPIYIHLSE